MSSKFIRIANGQGFWGDSIQAPIDLVNRTKIDYLTLDYLAEVTMSIMQRQKQKNPKLGYATDFVKLVENSAHLISRNKIKIIANAGGVNPNECRKAIMKVCSKKNINLTLYNTLFLFYIRWVDLEGGLFFLPI